ncbi:hypothetical protein KC336_g19289, partial [Hortaea werneckii]
EQEYQQFLQWRQQQQQRQQAPPPPPRQQQVVFQSQHAPMSTDQIFRNMANQLRQAYCNDAYNDAVQRVQFRVQQDFNRKRQIPPHYGGGPSQFQHPQFNQLQAFAAPQHGGGSFTTQQPQFNQPQGFAAPQYGGWNSQVQHPQFDYLQGFATPQYGAAPSGTQQPQYNQPQGFVAAQSTAPAAAEPEPWHAGFGQREPFAPQSMPAERTRSTFEAKEAPSLDEGTSGTNLSQLKWTMGQVARIGRGLNPQESTIGLRAESGDICSALGGG